MDMSSVGRSSVLIVPFHRRRDATATSRTTIAVHGRAGHRSALLSTLVAVVVVKGVLAHVCGPLNITLHELSPHQHLTNLIRRQIAKRIWSARCWGLPIISVVKGVAWHMSVPHVEPGWPLMTAPMNAFPMAFQYEISAVAPGRSQVPSGPNLTQLISP